MIKKRDDSFEEFDKEKIRKAVSNAFLNNGYRDNKFTRKKIDKVVNTIPESLESVEEVQDLVEETIAKIDFDVARAYILYREKHREARFIKERIDYMNRYADSSDNAATSSETDPNANVNIKNVANLEGEVYKTTNRIIQRQRMKDKLKQLYPEVAEQYEKDLNHHIIWVHDEASSPVVKNYCEAISLYPLLTEGVGNIDGVTSSPPQNLDAFCGQVVNLAFLLSAQCKGAVAFGGLFVAFNWYCVKEWGEDYYLKDNSLISSSECLKKRTIKERIEQAFQAIVYGWNQPAGNRSYQSPY